MQMSQIYSEAVLEDIYTSLASCCCRLNSTLLEEIDPPRKYYTGWGVEVTAYDVSFHLRRRRK